MFRQKEWTWAWQCGLVAKVLALNTPGSHMGAGSNPGSSTSHPAPCLQPGKAVEDGPNPWDYAPVWETLKKFLAPGFRTVRHWPLKVTRELKHQKEDYPLCLSSSL